MYCCQPIDAPLVVLFEKTHNPIALLTNRCPHPIPEMLVAFLTLAQCLNITVALLTNLCVIEV